MDNEQVSAYEEKLRQCSPMNLLGEPNDIANFVIYTASEDAKYITGSCLVVDGGGQHRFS